MAAMQSGIGVSASLLELLACPRDGLSLTAEDNDLRCPSGHSYPVVDGIPVLLIPELGQSTAPGARVHNSIMDSLVLAMNPGPDPFAGEAVHARVQEVIAATSGNMYRGLTLTKYPIPRLRWDAGNGATLLDVGCNWGRWTVSAAQAGYRAIGLDTRLRSLRAGPHVARACGVDALFVCGDARALPFKAESFDRCFSYSVVQHFSRPDARSILAEMSRVLKPLGLSLVQMPNRRGIRSRYQLARRAGAEGSGFDVRYYSPSELQELFTSVIGESVLSVDGFFGLGIQPDDVEIMPLHRKLVIYASEAMRWASQRQQGLGGFADSLYVSSRKSNPSVSPS